MSNKTKTQATKASPAAGMIEDFRRLNDFLRQGHTLEEAASAGLVRITRVVPKPKPTDAETAKKARELLDFTQAEFAAFLGVSSQSIKAWEQGQKVPTPPVKLLLKHIVTKPEAWHGFAQAEGAVFG
jgi:DNA-binding transcriptional regulator YiaG